MKKITTIMVAVDMSDYSLPSIRYANMLAQSLGAQIILVNIYNQRDVNAVRSALDAYYDPTWFDKIVEDNFASRREKMANWVAMAGAQETVVKQIVRIGIPHRDLLVVMEEEKPDLLVIVTKGRGNLVDTIVGSCAAKMHRHSPVHVLSLRPSIKDQ